MKERSRGKKIESAKSISASLIDYDALISSIAQAHEEAQRNAVQVVNVTLTLRNWLIGYHIVEYEQHGRDRANYGDKLIDNLVQDLRRRIGRGFGRRNLFLFREFYLRYPIVQSLIAQFGLTLPLRRATSLRS